MDFNSMVFPKPISSYQETDFKNELIWLPKKTNFSYNEIFKYTNLKTSRNLDSINPFERSQQNLKTCKDLLLTDTNIDNYTSNENLGKQPQINKIPNISFNIKNKFLEKNEKTEFIPCLFIKTDECNKKSDKILIYFHANYEDLGNCYNLLTALCKFNRINVLAVEFPGYGIYDNGKGECSADVITKDADIIYNFLNCVMKIKEENIVIMGRCIGSGPAVHLSTKFNPRCLLLMSAFTSILDAVKSIFIKYRIGWLIDKIIKDR